MDRRDAGQEGWQERRDSGEEGCWKMRIQDRSKQESRDAEQAGCRTEGMQD